MKCIAFYLPQFHQIPENDAWWGTGFTEWDNVRRARPIYSGQVQPKAPLNENYYDLTDSSVRNWQATIAREHGIYGFCYYHFWFLGKKLLERPSQLMLEEKSPDFPFCFSWANEPWTRAWDGSETEILQPQSYGDTSDWEAHFKYLLPFFLDKRYIRVDDKPVFLIYRPVNIPCIKEMIGVWRDLAKRNGLVGLHIVETVTHFPALEDKSVMDASVDFEPWRTISKMRPPEIKTKVRLSRSFPFIKKISYIDRPIRYSYREVWQKLLDTSCSNAKGAYRGAFVSWDNTPRRKLGGTVIVGSAPKDFEVYLAQQVESASLSGNEFLFVNAWNEWAEGAYLEPDIQHGHAYLEAVKSALVSGARSQRKEN